MTERSQHCQPFAARARPSCQRMLRVWPLRDAWTRETENLYAAWIEKLFDAPLDEELSWKSMDKVLHDPSRNILVPKADVIATNRDVR